MNSPQPKKVLFLCIGNSCRSQIAEGFACAYGSDVLVAESAGLAPAYGVARDTVRTMAEKDIDISGHIPKLFDPARASEFDLLVNMSGFELPAGVLTPVRTWDVADPIGQTADFYRMVRDEIEELVVELIRQFRPPAAEGDRGAGV